MSEICFNNILNASINQSCANEVNEYLPNAWLVRLKDCTNKTISNFEADIAVYGDIIPVFYPGDKEWQSIKKEGKRFKYGVDYTKTVDFVILEQTPKTEQLKRELSEDAWVLAIKQVDADKVQLIGLENGLRLSSTKQDLASVETHGALEVTMTEMSALQPLVSYSGSFYFKDGYEYITGLSIPENGAVNIVIDSDKKAYFKTASGEVYESVSGEIAIADIAADFGSVVIAIPKTNETLDLSGSSFSGDMFFRVNSLNNIILSNNNFTTEQCDYILDILIANGVVNGTYICNMESTLGTPSISKVNDTEALGWTVPF